jgi:ribosomal protein S16
MKRVGAKNAPVFRIVVADGRSPRDGKFIEEIGTYQPRKKSDNVRLDIERAKYWISKGAQPSDTVASFIKKATKAPVPAWTKFWKVMQSFLEFVVKGLVQNPNEVTVTPVEREGTTVYELRLHPQDVGKIIGRQGMTINAIRSLLLAGSARKGLRCTLEIVEEAPAR